MAGRVTSDDTRKPAAGPDRDGDSAAFGARVRQLREAKRRTLENLAAASGVSRAMLSKIERGESSPPIGVAKRIAEALETSLSFLAGAIRQKSAVVKTRRQERSVFRDPATGFERQLLSPGSIGSGIELVLHVLPPAASTGPLPAHRGGTGKHVFVTAGSVNVEIDGAPVLLCEGEALYFEADRVHAFGNAGPGPAEYLLVISSRRADETR